MNIVITDLPPALPVGMKCQTEVQPGSNLFGTVTLKYIGPFNPDSPCLFPITIETEDYAYDNNSE